MSQANGKRCRLSIQTYIFPQAIRISTRSAHHPESAELEQAMPLKRILSGLGKGIAALAALG